MKVGDLVRIKKPNDTVSGPTWVRSMDEFDGKVRRLIIVEDEGTGFIKIENTNGWWFDRAWVTPIHEKKIPRPKIPGIVVFKGQIREEVV